MNNTRLVLGALSVVLASGVQAASLYYFKVERKLEPIVGRYAVMSTDANGLAVTTGAKSVEPHAIPGWHVLQGGARPPSGRAEFSTPIYKALHKGHQFPTEFIMVGFGPEVSEADANRLLRSVVPGMRDLQTSYGNMHNVYRFRSGLQSGEAVLAAAAKLAIMDEVQFAEPDMVTTGGSSVIPTDPGFANTWGLRNTGQSGGLNGFDLNTVTAWDVTWGSPNILTLVIDTGTQQNHPDIRQVTGADFTGQGGGGGPVNTFDNHGTPVSGCISSIQNNGIGTVGSAPGSRVASARPFISINSGGNWNTQWSWTVDALTWGESLGARITNNSNYYGSQPSIVTAKYNQTYASGMVHFSSAGNFASTTIGYPANIPNVNAIIALNRFGARASFSDSGVGSDFSAPGQDIFTADRTGADGWVSGDYVFASGTSFASPYAAGIAALIATVNPYLLGNQIEQVMISTIRDLGAAGYDLGFGWGMPNASSALTSAGAIRMNGTVTFSDVVGLAPVAVRIAIDMTGTIRDTAPTSFSLTSGAYSTVAPLGAFTARFSWPGFLTRAVSVTNSGSVTTNVTLINGDINEDNEIGPADFAILAPAFGTFLGDPLFDARADLNRDGEVGPADFSILSGNFGLFGD